MPFQRRAHSSPSAISDVVRRGLSAAGMPSMLEPSGLDRGDGKRPDGITLYPYSRAAVSFWDATCVNTFASSNLIRAALAAGSGCCCVVDPTPCIRQSRQSGEGCRGSPMEKRYETRKW